MRYGLIGSTLSHSWSQGHFEKKFKDLGLKDHRYENLEFKHIEEVDKDKLRTYSGLNVTIPYKEVIIPYLDALSDTASRIGAVNCIEVSEGKLIGHNTDAYGFRDSLRPFLKSWHDKALILGTGGVSKAVTFVLEELGVEYRYVSRNPTEGQFSYSELNDKAVEIFPFIINCTPLGMWPNVESSPTLPYEALGPKNFLFDVVYNPVESEFLRKGRQQGTQTLNGLHMLVGQAEESWRIWNSSSARPTVDQDH